MKFMIYILSIFLFLFSLSNVSAQEISARYLGLTLEGGASAGYYWSNSAYNSNYGLAVNNTDVFSDNRDNIALSDLLLEMHSRKMGPMDAEIRFGIGNLKSIDILDGNANHALGSVYQTQAVSFGTGGVSSRTVDQKINLDDQFDVNLYYGQITVSPLENAYIEAGQLATNLGYEVSPTYANWNNALGLVWTKQPKYYPGARLKYEVQDANVYVEYNQNGIVDGRNAWAVGVYGTFEMVRYSASYFDTNNGRNVADLMIEADFPNVIAAINFDYHSMDTTPLGSSDRDAYAVAVYAIPHYQNYYLPLRVEYVKEGDSRIFGLDRAYTLTISPTIYMADNTFVRIEASYVSSANDVFQRMSDGLTSFTKWSMNAQVGYYF
ncbi:MAG: porin [Gammaproteobacteria bacterium]|nr:porin [Gammaproteobacteria bacterium]